MSLTVEKLKSILRYCPVTGIFTRIEDRQRGVMGKSAGATHVAGYIVIGIDRKYYRAHRLAWLYTFGAWPTQHLDHINGVRNDNRLVNLRQATRSQNGANRKISKHYTSSGLKGVYPEGRKFQASIRVNGRLIYLGCFMTAEAAHAAYLVAAKEHFGTYARAA